MAYYTSDLGDDGGRPYDYDEVVSDLHDLQEQVDEVLGRNVLEISFELSNDRSELDVCCFGPNIPLHYEIQFDDLQKYIKSYFPDKDWDSVGW